MSAERHITHPECERLTAVWEHSSERPCPLPRPHPPGSTAGPVPGRGTGSGGGSRTKGCGLRGPVGPPRSSASSRPAGSPAAGTAPPGHCCRGGAVITRGHYWGAHITRDIPVYIYRHISNNGHIYRISRKYMYSIWRYRNACDCGLSSKVLRNIIGPAP